MKTSLAIRNESFDQTKPEIGSRQKEVLDILIEHSPYTAWEISDILGRPVYQVRPRLTELENRGKLWSEVQNFRKELRGKNRCIGLLKSKNLGN